MFVMCLIKNQKIILHNFGEENTDVNYDVEMQKWVRNENAMRRKDKICWRYLRCKIILRNPDSENSGIIK